MARPDSIAPQTQFFKWYFCYFILKAKIWVFFRISKFDHDSDPFLTEIFEFFIFFKSHFWRTRVLCFKKLFLIEILFLQSYILYPCMEKAFRNFFKIKNMTNFLAVQFLKKGTRYNFPTTGVKQKIGKISCYDNKNVSGEVSEKIFIYSYSHIKVWKLFRLNVLRIGLDFLLCSVR